MSKRTFSRWVEIPESEPVAFRALLRLMVEAMHSDAFTQAVAERSLEAELRKLVDAGELMVRDPATLGPCTFTIGDAINRSVLLPAEDVAPLLESRGIGVRLIPFGKGPTHWTIDNAATSIAAQEGWHDRSRDTFREQMMQAARNGRLKVRHPHTLMEYCPDTVRAFYDLVTPADVNAWLALDPVLSLRCVDADRKLTHLQR